MMSVSLFCLVTAGEGREKIHLFNTRLVFCENQHFMKHLKHFFFAERRKLNAVTAQKSYSKWTF